MVEQFTVSLAGDSRTTTRHRQVLATLPEHFRVVASGPADARVVTHADDCGEARVHVVADTCTPLALPPGVDVDRVVPALQMLPRLRNDGSYALATAADFVLIDVTAAIPDFASTSRMLVEALAAYRGLIGTSPNAVALNRFSGGTTATFELADGPVCTFACVEAPGSSFRLSAVGQAARYAFEVEDDLTARPASIVFHDADGSHIAPRTYQHADRLTWLEVHAMLEDPDRRPAYGWAELTVDRRLIEAAIDGGG